MRYRGKVAAFQWVRTGEGMRANIHEPGQTEAVKLTDAHFHIAEAVRPRLVQDGIISEEQLQEASEAARKERVPLIAYLVSEELADSRAIAVAASHEFGVPLQLH